MKLSQVFISATLLIALVGCGQESTQKTEVELASCASIPNTGRMQKADLSIQCLDGSYGLTVANIGGPSIINVWGSWCEPCKQEIPILVEFYKELNPSIHLIGIDVEEKSIEDGREFARTHGMSWPNLYDDDGKTRYDFGMGVPVTLFISSDGEIAYKKIGVITSVDELRGLSEKYLGLS